MADALALGVVLLHPFRDGNGRTARVFGLVFRDNYDAPSYEEDFAVVTEPRDVARERGGFVINGYIPRLQEGADQRNPAHVSEYLGSLLKSDADGAYTSCYGQAPLRSGRASVL